MTHEEAIALLGQALVQEDRPDVGMADLQDELASGALIWTGERSAVLVRTRECTTGERVCDASPAAGDLEEILDRGTREIEAYARAAGCTQIHVQAGRDGWERALQPYGYERTAVIVRKLL